MNGRIQKRKEETGGSTLPEIGKIKVGKKSEKGFPTSTDYFIATGNFAKAFNSQYGDKPKQLTIAFASNDVNEVCNERYECWDKGKRYGWGNGETFSIWDANEKKYIDGIEPNDPRVQKLKWDTMLTLRFVLVEMRGILGYWTFNTKAKASSIPSIVKPFDFVRERAGTIAGFPFTLQVEKKQGYNPGDPKSYPVVTLVPNFTQESIEKVAGYIEQGGNLHSITTKFIQKTEYENMNTKQLGTAPQITLDLEGEAI